MTKDQERVVWVQRDEEGRLVGIYACYQDEIAVEKVPENHPDVVAYEEEQKEAMRLAFVKP